MQQKTIILISEFNNFYNALNKMSRPQMSIYSATFKDSTVLSLWDDPIFSSLLQSNLCFILTFSSMAFLYIF